jgi:hypothetical protein
MSLNFTVVRKGVSILATQGRHEFDVRTDGSVDMSSAEEMVSLGRISNSVVTTDYVFLDGRTGGVAQQIKSGTLGLPESLIVVDVLGFKYDTLNNTDKREFQAEALRRNFPVKGFRRFATDEDCILAIVNMLNFGSTKAQIAIALDFLGARFGRQYDIAKTTVVNRKIAQARGLMADNPRMNAEDAARKVGLDSPEGIIPQQGAPRDKTFHELKAKQAAIAKAITQVQKYAKDRLQWLRDGKISGLTINRLLDHETKQVCKLVKTHDDAKLRVEKEVAAVIPGFHTK